MNEELMVAMDECMTALAGGASLDDCLKRYPDLAEELTPLLETAIRLQTLMNSIQPSPESQETSRAKFLMQAAQLETETQVQKPFNKQLKRKPVVTTPVKKPATISDFLSWLLHPQFSRTIGVVVILGVVFMAGAGVWRVSAQSLPGTPLYGVKRMVEDTQLVLSPNAESRASLEEKFINQHVQEVRQVTELGWSAPLEFGGLLDSIDGENWSVGGIAIVVPASAIIEGNPQVGLYVKVRGEAQTNGMVLVSQITVSGFLFQGRVDDIRSGIWRIDGKVVFTSQDTLIVDNPGPGDQVEINAMQLSDGNLLAEKIRLVSRQNAGSDLKPKNDLPDTRLKDGDATRLPGNEDKSGQTAKPTTHSSGSDDNSSKTPEPTNTLSGHDDGDSGSNDGASKTPEPTLTPSEQDDGGNSGPSKTPEPTHTLSGHDDGGNGGNDGASRTPEPTHTPSGHDDGGNGGNDGASKTPEPTHTPSGHDDEGGSGGGKTPEPTKTPDSGNGYK